MTDTEISKLMLQGKQYLDSRDFSNAKKCYLDVIREKSNESGAYYFLGVIATQENQIDEACAHFKKLLELQPYHKQCLLELAALYTQTDQFQDAIKLFQQYLRLDSKQAGVFYHYACTLLKAGDVNLALEALQQSIKLNPKELAPYMTLGELLYRYSKYRDAQQVYLSAYHHGLKSEGLYQNLAKLHVDHGELEQAKEMLANAIEDYPDSFVFSYRLYSMDSQCLTSALYQKLTSHESEAISPDKQFYRHWLLAQYAKKEGDPATEMDFLVKAHCIHEEISPFNHDADFYLNNLPQLPLPSTISIEKQGISPIFIIGVPRCGSTLIENIICSGPERVLKGEEPGVIMQAATNNLQNDEDVFWLKFQEQAKAHYQQCKLLEDNVRFTDKSLENIFLVDFILALYPNAKVIYCDRSPLASIVSIMKNNMVLLPWAHDLDKIFQYVDNSLSAIEKWTQKYPESIYTVQYERLVTKSEEESKKLMAFCDLPWDESCLSFHQAEGLVSRTASHVQIRKAINQNALSAYQVYKPFFERYQQQYPWLNQ